MTTPEILRFYDENKRFSLSIFFSVTRQMKKKSRDLVFMGNQRRYLETGKVN